jgi:hypothetical protein
MIGARIKGRMGALFFVFELIYFFFPGGSRFSVHSIDWASRAISVKWHSISKPLGRASPH